MAHPKKNKIQLSNADVKKLQGILKKRIYTKQLLNAVGSYWLWRKIVLLCRLMTSVWLFCVSHPTIANVAKIFTQDGLDVVSKLKCNANLNNVHCKVDGCMEARIVEIACGPDPEGHGRWTLRFLKEQAKLEFEEPVNREAFRRS